MGNDVYGPLQTHVDLDRKPWGTLACSVVIEYSIVITRSKSDFFAT
jgi:hypothetical protein